MDETTEDKYLSTNKDNENKKQKLICHESETKVYKWYEKRKCHLIFGCITLGSTAVVLVLMYAKPELFI